MAKHGSTSESVLPNLVATILLDKVVVEIELNTLLGTNITVSCSSLFEMHRMLRLYCVLHTHDFCFLLFTQEAEPAPTTNNTSNENGPHNIIATQCAAVAESATGLAESATVLATMGGAAYVLPTVAAPATPVGGTLNETSTPSASTPTSPLDFDAFGTDSYGHTRNVIAARRSRARAVETIVSAIVSVGTSAQQSLALHKALAHPTIHQIAVSASLGPDQACWHLQRENVSKIIEEANRRQGKGGRSDNVKSAFVKSLMVAMASTPDKLKQNPSLRKQAVWRWV
jgi:hypothetical protein